MLVFLHHAYSRYLAVAEEAAAGRPTRGGRVRPLAKQDFSQRGGPGEVSANDWSLAPPCTSAAPFRAGPR